MVTEDRNIYWFQVGLDPSDGAWAYSPSAERSDDGSNVKTGRGLDALATALVFELTLRIMKNAEGKS